MPSDIPTSYDSWKTTPDAQPSEPEECHSCLQPASAHDPVMGGVRLHLDCAVVEAAEVLRKYEAAAEPTRMGLCILAEAGVVLRDAAVHADKLAAGFRARIDALTTRPTLITGGSR